MPDMKVLHKVVNLVTNGLVIILTLLDMRGCESGGGSEEEERERLELHLGCWCSYFRKVG